MDSSPRNPERGSPRPHGPARRPPRSTPFGPGRLATRSSKIARKGGRPNRSQPATLPSLATNPRRWRTLPNATLGTPRHKFPRRPSHELVRSSTGPETASEPCALPPRPLRDPPATHDERLARAAAYLAKIPPAVAGERGHDRTFHAACVLVQGFDLTIDEARPLLHQWNLGCIPPWSPAELEHKLHDALRAGDSRPRGYLWDRGSRPTA